MPRAEHAAKYAKVVRCHICDMPEWRDGICQLCYLESIESKLYRSESFDPYVNLVMAANRDPRAYAPMVRPKKGNGWRQDDTTQELKPSWLDQILDITTPTVEESFAA